MPLLLLVVGITFGIAAAWNLLVWAAIAWVSIFVLLMVAGLLGY